MSLTCFANYLLPSWALEIRQWLSLFWTNPWCRTQRKKILCVILALNASCKRYSLVKGVSVNCCYLWRTQSLWSESSTITWEVRYKEEPWVNSRREGLSTVNPEYTSVFCSCSWSRNGKVQSILLRVSRALRCIWGWTPVPTKLKRCKDYQRSSWAKDEGANL